jgi:hypothetical protein
MYFDLAPNQLRRRSAILLLIGTSLLSARASLAQEISPDCSAADLDISYRFLNSPPNETVIANLRNTSQRACNLRPGGGITFNDIRHGHNIWTTGCRNCDAEGKPQHKLPVAIAAGETAHLTVSWETSPVGSIACQDGGSFDFYVTSDPKHPYRVWAGSVLGDVCSVVRVDSYTPGAFHLPTDDAETEGALKQSNVTIRLTPSGEVFYGDDAFWLDVDISDPDENLPLDAHSCPSLLLRTRATDGTTTLQDAGGSCHLAESKEGSGRSIRSKIWTMGQGAFAGAEMRVELFALLSAPHAPEVRMIGSNAVVLRRVDPSSIGREWGPQVSGLAVSLFLDKQEYLVGEDIPLRLAVENFSASGEIWSGELPCLAGLTFEVRDSKGNAVQSRASSVCMGHGWTQVYPVGEVVPVLGLTLSGQGHLPDRPGDYTVTATWQPCANGRQIFSSTPRAPYAVVLSSPVTFRVVARDR